LRLSRVKDQTPRPPPPVLYKYCDIRGLDILQQLRLKVTPPDQFNDPFEFTPATAVALRPRRAKKFVKDKKAMREVYDELVSSGVFKGNFRSFRHSIHDQADMLAQNLIDKYPNAAAEFRADFIKMASAEFGVICLSETSEDLLMWSHYTRSHTGLVIGFNTANPFFETPRLHEVEYREERSLIDPGLDPKTRRFQEETVVVVRRKSSHWAYEHEWRQLHFLRLCRAEPNGNNRSNFFADITPQALSLVILGCRFPKSEESQLSALLQRPEFSHIQLRRARLHDSEFKLVFDQARISLRQF
jgi:hypothetical protein